MVKAFLDSVQKGVEELGWSSAKKIADHTNWAVEDVTEALGRLTSDGLILMRKKGRGHQYGPLEETRDTNKPSSVEEIPSLPNIPPNPDAVFSTLDEFLLDGSLSLPKNHPFSANEFGTELKKLFPKVKWTIDDIIDGIGKLVRLGRLDLRPFLDGAHLKYHYIVK